MKFTIDTTPISGLSDDQPRSARAIARSTGRKTFKTNKESKEAVWPEYLEAVLIEAILRYTPPAARGARTTLQRFPKRNKLIAQYIKEVTGRSRSSKQVGSRIQQLRGTCRDPILMNALVDRRRFEAQSDRSSASSRSASRTRSISREVATPSLHFSPLPLPSDSLDAPLSPSSTIVRPTITQSICIDLTIADEDWNHHGYVPSSMFIDIDLDDPTTVRNTVTDYPLTVNSVELHLAPVTVIRSFDLDRSARYRITSTIYRSDAAVYSHVSESVTSPDCRLTSSLVPEYWSEIIGTMNHAHMFTLIQAVEPIDSLASPSIDIVYTVRMRYQTACVSPVSSPGSTSSFEVVHGFADFVPYTQVVSSPIDSGEFIDISSSHTSLSTCSSSSAYAAPCPQPYSGETWSYSEPHSLHLQPSYNNHYAL